MNEQFAAMEAKAVKAILFDLDNTLIETSRAGRSAITKVTRPFEKASMFVTPDERKALAHRGCLEDAFKERR